MYILYSAPGTAGLLVHWLLIELDAPYDLRVLDLQAGEQKQPAYLALNPSGTVPTLLVDGQPMSEACAIALWLAEQDRTGRLRPDPQTPAYRHYLQHMLHLANGMQPAFRHWFYPHEAAGEAQADAAKASARALIEAWWQRFDRQLQAHGPYLQGDAPHAADFYLTMLMRWSRNMPRPATEWPALARHAALMKGRPSFKTLYAREGLTEWN